MGLLSMLALSHQGVDRREPAVSIHARAINHVEEFFLQPLGDGAPAAGADGDPVDRADRRNFRRRAAEENLVGDVQQFARNDALHYWDAGFPGQREDGVARDAGKDASAQRRRVDLTVPHYKDVLAGTFADVAGHIQRDAFGVAVGDGFHFDELRVHVIGAGLGERGQRVGGHAAPTGDADIDAFGERLFAQILAPGPAGDEDVDGVLHAVDAHLPVAAHDDGAQVAGIHFVDADQFQHGFGELIGGETDIVHAVNFGRIQHAADVLAQAEHGRSGRRGITANAFEYAAAIAHDMREDVNGGG